MPDTDPKFITRAEAHFSIRELECSLHIPLRKYDNEEQVERELTPEEYQAELSRREGKGEFGISITLYGEVFALLSPRFNRSNPAEREAAFREMTSNAGTALFKKLTQ